MSAPAQVIDRLIEVLRDETAALRDRSGLRHPHLDHAQAAPSCLSCITCNPVASPPERLEGLREALEENRLELAARLDVSRQIADLVIGVVREDVRDGTYSAATTRR